MALRSSEHEVVRNTIARYCVALDNKDFDLLHDVFTPDVDAKYPVLTNYKGERDVNALSHAIQERLAPVTTQHALSTQMIKIFEDKESAEAMTYFSGIHFGKGKWEGQEVTVYGKYIDTLIRDTTQETLLKPNTRWLISKRELVVMGRTGEVRVMEGE